MKLGLSLIALVFFAASCGSVGDAVGEAAVPGSASPDLETTGSSVPEGRDFALGDKVTVTPDGNTLVVLRYESPLNPAGSAPDSELSAIEVEGCAGPQATSGGMQVGSASFALSLPDGGRIAPLSPAEAKETGLEEPVLETMDPVPNGCERGLVIFRVPKGERPEAVAFKDSLSTDTTPVTWSVPKE